MTPLVRKAAYQAQTSGQADTELGRLEVARHTKARELLELFRIAHTSGAPKEAQRIRDIMRRRCGYDCSWLPIGTIGSGTQKFWMIEDDWTPNGPLPMLAANVVKPEVGRPLARGEAPGIGAFKRRPGSDVLIPAGEPGPEDTSIAEAQRALDRDKHERARAALKKFGDAVRQGQGVLAEKFLADIRALGFEAEIRDGQHFLRKKWATNG